MRIVVLLLLINCLQVNAQNSALKVTIDSVIASDSDPKGRQFTINYHITNLTDKMLSVHLDPTGLITSTRASMSSKPYYKIYQNDEFVEADDILRDKEDFLRNVSGIVETAEEHELALRKRVQETMNVDIDSARAAFAVSEEAGVAYVTERYRKIIMKQVYAINPKEILSFSQTLYWDRKRYYTYEHNEYYLDEKENHYIDITVVLLREKLKEELAADQFAEIAAKNDLVEGSFTSNKMPVNFKE